MEKYFKILEELENQKIDIVKLFLLSSIKFTQDNKKEEWNIVNYCYDMWLEIDDDIDLAKLADIVVEHWEEILNEEYSYDDIVVDLFC